MDAQITLTGNVGTDVEAHRGDGWTYARFRLACTPRVMRDGEWVDDHTTWLTVRATNRLAENVIASVSKGDPLVVTGRVRTQVWELGTGERQDRLVVHATSIGHDLGRGTSIFVRSTRAATAPEVQSEDDAQEASEHAVEAKVMAGV